MNLFRWILLLLLMAPQLIILGAFLWEDIKAALPPRWRDRLLERERRESADQEESFVAMLRSAVDDPGVSRPVPPGSTRAGGLPRRHGDGRASGS